MAFTTRLPPEMTFEVALLRGRFGNFSSNLPLCALADAEAKGDGRRLGGSCAPDDVDCLVPIVRVKLCDIARRSIAISTFHVARITCRH